MTKNLLLIFTFLFATISIRAQYVNIPDLEFRTCLKSKYPSCFDNNNMMDTTCSNIVNATTLNIASWGPIVNLEGIQYFKSLSSLYCQHNQITNIPSLPSSLLYFDCSRNSLTSLPDLPTGLLYLNCSDNLLTMLPKLNEVLGELNCYKNELHCLPSLPKSLFNVFLDTSFIHCVPNTTDATFYNQGTTGESWKYVIMPICNSNNNLNACTVTSSLSGRVYYDNNVNGILDAGDCYKADIEINLINNSEVYNDSTNTNGLYLFKPENLDNYNLSVGTLPDFYKAIPASSIIDFTAAGTVVKKDIALQSALDNPDSLFIYGNGGFSAGGSYSILIPGQTSWYENGSINIEYENRGTTTISPIITLNYDSSLIRYDHSSTAGVNNNGKSLVFTEPSLAPGESKIITFYFSKDSSNGNPNLGLWNFVTTASIVNNSKGNVISFINQVVGILPIKLTAFNAHKELDNSTTLSWNTTNEINAKSFVVEQSSDGIHFNYEATITAKRQNSNTYNYTLKELKSSTTCFRLKMIDADGKFSYSDIVKVNLSTDLRSTIEVFPNPASKWIKIRTIINPSGNNLARLFNGQGVLVRQFLLQQATQTVDISGLPSGLYYLQTGRSTKKISIVN